jgi:hypothetical protein
MMIILAVSTSHGVSHKVGDPGPDKIGRSLDTTDNQVNKRILHWQFLDQ